MKTKTTFYSAWDWLPWTVILLTILVCIFSVIAVSVTLAIILTVFLVLTEVAVFLSTYYEINNDELLVHSSFKVAIYPIDKIKEIKSTNSWLAAPAASISKRIAITFTEKGITKSFMPLIISPAKQHEFIARLLAINPEIRIHVK